MRWIPFAFLCGCGAASADATPVIDSEVVVDSASVDSAVVDTAVVETSPIFDSATVDTAEPPCVPGALLCEDFESGKIDETVWKEELNNATLEVETGRAANGKYALHARVQGPKVDVPNEAFLHERVTFPVAANRFFGRAMVFVERNLPDKNFVLVEATGQLADGSGARYGLGGINSATDGQLFRLVYHPGDYVERSTSRPPVGKWACWEWQIDGSNDSMRVWLDGGAMPEARATDEKPPWIAPQFRDLAIGFRIPHPDSHAAYDVWIDDIVIGTTRPGCPK